MFPLLALCQSRNQSRDSEMSNWWHPFTTVLRAIPSKGKGTWFSPVFWFQHLLSQSRGLKLTHSGFVTLFCTPCTTVNTFCLHTDNAFVSDTNTIIRLCSTALPALGLDDTLSFKMPDFMPWVVSLLKSWGYWPFSLIPEFHFQYYRIKIRRW